VRRRRELKVEEGPQTSGGGTGPPKGPPQPPRSTAEGSLSPGGDDSEMNAEGKGVFKWKGWEDRVKADSQFVYKVLVEQVCAFGCLPHDARLYW
jgi:hypothetical protein